MSVHPIRLAHKTFAAIESVIFNDQGAAFRTNLQKVIPHIGDAYRGEDEGFRSHLGASQIGRPCAREIWYGFRWALKPRFMGRMIRLFNRGHLEEARFIAMLLSIGVQVYQQDANGKQFRISELGGHFGGSGDGVAIGLPDFAPDTPALLEFKTHNDKSFNKLVEKGVKVAKPEHYAQMQTYMRKMGLAVALYGAVNKNDDALHLEIVHLDTIIADQYIDRGRQIVMMQTAPEKIADSPGWYECKYCDMKGICHNGKDPEVNCRTCHFVRVHDDGTWRCGNPVRARTPNRIWVDRMSDYDDTLTKEEQLKACQFYVKF